MLLPSTVVTLPSPFIIIIIIIRPESSYLFFCPTEGGRLSRLGTAVRVCSLCPRLYIAVAVVINKTAAKGDMTAMRPCVDLLWTL